MGFWKLLFIITFVMSTYYLLRWLGMWSTVYPSIEKALDSGWNSLQEIFTAFR